MCSKSGSNISVVFSSVMSAELSASSASSSSMSFQGARTRDELGLFVRSEFDIGSVIVVDVIVPMSSVKGQAQVNC
jgi:hypothetical protein